MKKRSITAIIVLILIPIHSFTTCIQICIVKKSIFIAADSRSNLQIVSKDGVEQIGRSICKINHVGNSYFAISGHYDGELLENAVKACQKYKDINKAMNYFGNQMDSIYKIKMTKERVIYPTDFTFFLKNDLALVAFFGFKKDLPYLYVIPFRMKASDRLIFSYQIHTNTIVELGIHDHLDKLTLSEYESQIEDKRGTIYTLENLVKLEIKYHPTDINYPIDLLELTNNQVKWIRKKSECN